MSLTIISPSFSNNGIIPLRHTCDGLDISPALKWTGVPEAARSLVLIVEDPDAPDPIAPKTRWVHWILYNLPTASSGIPEGVSTGDMSSIARHGLNDWRRLGYSGPCPPIGVHRYFFQLYALDVMLPDLHHPFRAALQSAMQNHVIDCADLVGRYQRQY